MTRIISFDIGIRNLAYCIIDNDKIVGWSKVDLGCKRHDMQGLVDSMIDLLDNIIENELDINVESQSSIIVLIEQQMTAVMKCLQTAINVYFKMVKRYKSLDVETYYVSPKLKMTFMSSHDDFISPFQKTTKYDQNKADSVSFTKWFLNTHKKDELALEYLKEHKKIDDLCDAYCQANAWLEKNGKKLGIASKPI